MSDTHQRIGERMITFLIDAPPTLGGWVMNILCASDEIIIPVESTPWGLFGLGNMFEFLRKSGVSHPDRNWEELRSRRWIPERVISNRHWRL